MCRYVQAIASKASKIVQLHCRYEAEEHCQHYFLEPNTVWLLRFVAQDMASQWC